MACSESCQCSRCCLQEGEPRVIHIRDTPSGYERYPLYVYIGRPRGGQVGSLRPGDSGYFGNPFALSKKETRGATISSFERWARRRLAEDCEYKEAVRGLKDKVLVCFCKPHPCHGDVLARLCLELNAEGAR